MARDEPDWRIEPQGDRALVVVFGSKVDAALNQRARTVAEAISHARLAGVLDVVPAICAVTVHYRPEAVPREARGLPWRALEQRLEVTIAAVAGKKPRAGREVRIPVCYGGEFGPDLEEAAERTGIAAGEIVRLHSDAEHLVYMLGFSPGQPYIGGLPAKLALPRRATPRLKVARGSIAIAQGMTAIYALETPGGWNVIGRTPAEMFLPQQDPPCLLRPGDSVRFDPITRIDYDARTRRERARVSIAVIRPGLQSTLQDLGRYGYQAYGVVVDGAMDDLSHRIANLLVGNADDEATLEMTLRGPELAFAAPAVVAVAGADLQPRLDGKSMPDCRPVAVGAGSRLAFGQARTGCRAYLAVAGGFDCAPVLGSRSTFLRGALGGHAGRALRAGDQLALRAGGAARFSGLDGPASWYLPPPYDARPPEALRVLAGRHWGLFTEENRALLLGQAYRVGAQSDRMGYRLEGPAILPRRALDLPSEATSFGTVQVPPDGQPIVLMADRQTTGGYPKIAEVAGVDLPRIAQRRPGEVVRFELVSLDDAQRLLLERDAALGRMREAVRWQLRT